MKRIISPDVEKCLSQVLSQKVFCHRRTIFDRKQIAWKIECVDAVITISTTHYLYTLEGTNFDSLHPEQATYLDNKGLKNERISADRERERESQQDDKKHVYESGEKRTRSRRSLASSNRMVIWPEIYRIIGSRNFFFFSLSLSLFSLGTLILDVLLYKIYRTHMSVNMNSFLLNWAILHFQITLNDSVVF